QNRKAIKYILILLLFSSISLWYLVFTNLDTNLHFYTFDIGQGDALMFKLPKNQEILIDTGKSEKVLTELGKVMPIFDNTIELLILTHPDNDHIKMADKIIKKYRVLEIWTNGDFSSAEMANINNIAKDKNILIKTVKTGDNKIFENTKNNNQLLVKTIYPLDNINSNSDNNNSLVESILYKDVRFLLTGDFLRVLNLSIKLIRKPQLFLWEKTVMVIQQMKY
ncbi:MAG: competence protein ComEC, partial [Candidatus Berkelbacteria bacterium Licking1014_85]